MKCRCVYCKNCVLKIENESILTLRTNACTVSHNDFLAIIQVLYEITKCERKFSKSKIAVQGHRIGSKCFSCLVITYTVCICVPVVL